MTRALLVRGAAALLLVASSAACSVLNAKTLRIGVTDEPLNLSAAYADESSALVGGLVQAGLYRPDSALRPQPLLAEGSPVVSAGGTAWSITLKPGLTFHDGSSVTPDDVVFTYELAKDGQCPLSADICDLVRTRLETVEADGVDGVRFHLFASWAPWGTRGLTIPILPKAALEASLARLQAEVAHADRNAVTLTRENLAAELESGTCTTAATGGCDYASHLTELERTLSAAGLTLPDTRQFPQRDSNGAPTGARDDEAYARDLYARLGELEELQIGRAHV